MAIYIICAYKLYVGARWPLYLRSKAKTLLLSLVGVVNAAQSTACNKNKNQIPVWLAISGYTYTFLNRFI